jgi:hypothetical protein
MNKLITTIAILFATTAFAQKNYNVEKDEWVSFRLNTKSLNVKFTKIPGDPKVPGQAYYEMVFPEMKILVFYSPAGQVLKTPEVLEVNILNDKGEEIASNYAEVKKENKISAGTIDKIKKKALAIK